jgi:hypothetical protein
MYGTDTGPALRVDRCPTALHLVEMEPMTGIEPAYSAWEVGAGRPVVSECIRLSERRQVLSCGNSPALSEFVRHCPG